MNREGPPLESLLRRVAETPAPFLAEPRGEKTGVVHVAAVVADLCRRFPGTAREAHLARLEAAGDARNRLATALLFAWLFDEPWFAAAGLGADDVAGAIAGGAEELARTAGARKYVADPERREELVRLALARVGCRPAGESEAEAQDRLSSLSAAERARVMQATRAAEQRARAIRAALAQQAAQAAADKYSRE